MKKELIGQEKGVKKELVSHEKGVKKELGESDKYTVVKSSEQEVKKE